tara:strand:+ start:154 stop:597 length:444 start_codon:yes stop_codon:yes gene_type:complete
MRKWGRSSQEVYDTLDPRLQHLMNYCLTVIGDISLISGHRSEEEQNALFKSGKSKLKYPNSKHNSNPSMAVDFQPYPMPNINAKNKAVRARAERTLWASLAYTAGAARTYALANGWKLRWGGDWDGDGDLTDQTFNDLFHLELQVDD